MPRRKKITRQHSGVSDHDIEMLRRAIQNGFPWVLWQKNDIFRTTGLGIRLNILLSYVTGISAGVAVWLSGEVHPSPEAVRATRESLQADIDAAEEKNRGVFVGKRYKESAFR